MLPHRYGVGHSSSHRPTAVSWYLQGPLLAISDGRFADRAGRLVSTRRHVTGPLKTETSIQAPWLRYDLTSILLDLQKHNRKMWHFRQD